MSRGRGVCLPKPASGEVELPLQWEDALRTAYDIGAGRDTIDARDDDMLDAARLATPTGEGGILWHPSSLDDIYDVPSRTLILFDFMRLGAVARQQPWTWWRVAKTRSTAHQYMTDWMTRPQIPARCGFEPKGDLERHELAKCAKCEKLDQGEPEPEATGTVAGVRVAFRDDRRTERP